MSSFIGEVATSFLVKKKKKVWLINYLRVIGEVAVGDGDGGGALDGVYNSVFALGHGTMVDPNVGGSKDSNAVSFVESSETLVGSGVSDYATGGGFDLLDLQVRDDDVLHKLHRDARAARDFHVRAAPVDGLVARH